VRDLAATASPKQGPTPSRGVQRRSNLGTALRDRFASFVCIDAHLRHRQPAKIC
jgi:hypothetical protein